MPDPSPLQPEVTKATRALQELSEDLAAAYEEALKNQSPEKAIDTAFKKVGYEAAVTDITMTGVEASIATGGLELRDKVGFRKWYLSRKWRGQDFNLSSNIHRITRESKAEITRQIRLRLRAGKAWNDLAVNIRRVGVTKGELPGYLQQVERAARRALGGNPKEKAAYVRYLKAAQKRIERLSTTTSASVRLKKAYSNFIFRTQELDAETFINASKRAHEAVAHYRASRVAITESARAYGLATGQQIEDDEDAVGVIWRLSSAHKVVDICALNAGVWPKNRVPSFPAHPFCMCQLEPAYRKKPHPDYQAKLKAMSVSDRKKLLGVRGAEAFESKPGGFRKYLRNKPSYRPLTGDDEIPAKFLK